jgi:dTMP kinase
MSGRGYFFSFEGGEGAGKSTQIAALAEWLRGEGYPILLTREPGGSAHGKRIRTMILEHHPDEVLSPRAELFLYLADRAHHVETIIRPALEQGKTVLCDRYTDSTLAYQGYGRGLDLNELRALNQAATGGLQPDLTLWLDLDPVIGQTRIGSRTNTDRLERENLAFHQRVRNGYRALSAAEPERWCRIEADEAPGRVYANLQARVSAWLSHKI